MIAILEGAHKTTSLTKENPEFKPAVLCLNWPWHKIWVNTYLMIPTRWDYNMSYNIDKKQLISNTNMNQIHCCIISSLLDSEISIYIYEMLELCLSVHYKPQILYHVNDHVPRMISSTKIWGQAKVPGIAQTPNMSKHFGVFFVTSFYIVLFVYDYMYNFLSW